MQLYDRYICKMQLTGNTLHWSLKELTVNPWHGMMLEILSLRNLTSSIRSNDGSLEVDIVQLQLVVSALFPLLPSLRSGLPDKSIVIAAVDFKFAIRLFIPDRIARTPWPHFFPIFSSGGHG